MNGTRTRIAAVLVPLLLFQAVLVAVAVYPQLSARLTGEEVTLRVRPLDPIDPFRGAYVTFGYPDLRRNAARSGEGGGLGSMEDGASGTVYVSLRQEGDLWVADRWTRTPPEGGTYLRCTDRDWQIRCGIESWFLPQDEAAAMEQAVRQGSVIATIKVDGRGNAALVEISP